MVAALTLTTLCAVQKIICVSRFRALVDFTKKMSQTNSTAMATNAQTMTYIFVAIRKPRVTPTTAKLEQFTTQ
jgi:hypothetical protein